MMKIKKRKKKKIWKTTGYFLLIFVLCTILSRGLYTFSVANVTLTIPQQYVIDHSVQTSGTLQTIREIPVYIKEGMMIDEILVLEGTKVSKGDTIARLNVEKIEKKVKELNEEIYLYTLQIQEAKAMEPVILTTVKQLEVQMQRLVDEKTELESIVRNKGEIISEYTGTVTKIQGSVGEQTVETAFLLISDDKKGFIIEVLLKEEEAKYISKNSKVDVSAEKIKAKKSSIISLRNSEQGVLAKISVKDSEFTADMNVQIAIESEKKTYEFCIPIQAIHQEGLDKYYVYTIDREETVMGEKMVAKQIPVRIVDKDNSYVAIEDGDISSGTEIIVSSDKLIEQESPVRIRGENDEW